MGHTLLPTRGVWAVGQPAWSKSFELNIVSDHNSKDCKCIPVFTGIQEAIIQQPSSFPDFCLNQLIDSEDGPRKI